MKKLFKWIIIIFIGLIVIGVIFGDDSAEQETTAVQPIEESTASQVANVTPEQTKLEQEVTVEEPKDLTRPQKNAVRSAEQYIKMTGFSREGLIEQLSSDAGDGYEVDDVTVAVDSLNVDWNEQAVRSAEQYLDIMGFSCDGLVEQLSSSAGSKYTVSEATHGAQQAGACS